MGAGVMAPFLFKVATEKRGRGYKSLVIYALSDTILLLPNLLRRSLL